MPCQPQFGQPWRTQPPATHPIGSSNSKHVRLPEFDGSGNVQGFLTVFERNCRILGMDQETMLGSLMGKLSGAAASWLQGHEEDTLYWDYLTLRQQLVEHFGGERMTHVRALQCLK